MYGKLMWVDGMLTCGHATRALYLVDRCIMYLSKLSWDEQARLTKSRVMCARVLLLTSLLRSCWCSAQLSLPLRCYVVSLPTLFQAHSILIAPVALLQQTEYYNSHGTNKGADHRNRRSSNCCCRSGGAWVRTRGRGHAAVGTLVAPLT
jgi:hypothetical protein